MNMTGIENRGPGANTVLNLGCGIKTSDHPDVINIDWSMYLRLRSNAVTHRLAPLLLDPERREKYFELPANIIVHDLARGVPMASGSVDAVYHSHLLEHLDRNTAPRFLAEIYRALRPGGVHRVVVPDLERLCRSYLDHLRDCETDTSEWSRHDQKVAAIIEQSVRHHAFSSAAKSRLRAWVEMIVLGNARRRGETHRWMYDWVNLSSMLLATGFEGVERRTYKTSQVSSWARYGLDVNGDGGEYKPDSLYIEAIKPLL